jgi:hypothetical protein
MLMRLAVFLVVLLALSAHSCSAIVFNPAPDDGDDENASLTAFHAHRRLSHRLSHSDAHRMMTSDVRHQLLWRGADEHWVMHRERTRAELLSALDDHLRRGSHPVVSTREHRERVERIHTREMEELRTLSPTKTPTSQLRPGFTKAQVERARKDRIMRRNARKWLVRSGFPETIVYTGPDAARLARKYEELLESGDRPPLPDDFLDDYPTTPSVLENAHEPRLTKDRTQRLDPKRGDLHALDRSAHPASHQNLANSDL